MAVPPQAYKRVKPRGTSPRRPHPAETAKTETKPEIVQHETDLEDVVMFTSYDGTIREVGALPPNLGRATALASERSVSKVWATSEEEAVCHDMRKEV